ncbi:hypothetical protein [Azospirillum picis]|uniref:Cell division septal protein FtsQ n=1 Tax=Azospirillum picis TaxID=488438 RepID=A0ABU0MSI6_9PROT|nr:hypothetical protein [Azospirillum picis]MBP2302705.1 cell division septal protein FtsQ [Azospirillum picis]MDQ0536456.1 cell division septal protein FtsQ [Azospirillum picis]
MLSQRHGPRFAGNADAGRFLSPEQQFLLKRRREVEQREAKRRRSLTGLVLAVTCVAAGVVWAALRL